jgi:hypothetical protein
MTRLARALVLTACIFAAPAGAQSVLERAAAFVAVAQTNGCALTVEEAEALLPPAGLTMADAQAAAAVMNRGRLFTVDDDRLTLRLIPDLCAADAAGVAALLAAAAEAPEPRIETLGLADRIDPARGAAFVAEVRATGCAMSEDQAAAILPGLGFDRAEVQDIAELLMETGLAGLVDDAFTLSPELCAADPAADPETVAAALAAYVPGVAPLDVLTVRRALNAMAAGSGCTLDAADLTALSAALADWLGEEPDAEGLSALVAGVLAEPGPEFILDAGQLRLANCTP